MPNRTANPRSPRSQPIPPRAGHALRVSLCVVAVFYWLAQSVAAKETAADFLKTRIRPLLTRDLKQPGLRDETRIAICTEFGRTPWDSGPGRNHWHRAFSALLAGADIQGEYYLWHNQ